MSAEIEITVAAPHRLSEEERAAFSNLVQQGGEVGGDALATNIRSAKALILVRCAEEIKGITALKRPQASYRRRICEKAGVKIEEDSFPYELGYVLLLPEMQGKRLSHRLVAHALEHADGAGVFATTRTDNGAMLATLAKAGFKPVGDDYKGRGTRMIRLLVRPAP